MSDVPTDFLLNLASEFIGIVITVVVIERLIRRQERKRTKLFQDKIQSRMADHIRGLSTWIQMLAIEKDKEMTDLVKNDIISRRQQLAQLAQIGESVLELNLQNELIELDRQLDILLNMHAVIIEAPANLEYWKKDVDNALSQIIVVAKLIGEIGTAIGSEAWLEVYRSHYGEEDNPEVDSKSPLTRKKREKRGTSPP